MEKIYIRLYKNQLGSVTIQLGSATTQLRLCALTDDITSREMFMKGIDYSYYYEEE